MTDNIDFERIKELIHKYEELKASDEVRKYNEEMTKKDFIQPLFEALGWNVYNRSKKSDSVSAEEKVSKGRVDYGFRMNGIPKFFLEAKSLREDSINYKIEYLRQAIDYAWMKSCSWAILTNFESLVVINADVKESNLTSSIFFVLHPADFLDDYRFRLLSKKSFETGGLDEEATRWGKRQFKKPIDAQLLEDLIEFRQRLSESIKENNSDGIKHGNVLDESVQRILDRLIFIRNAEDRGLEPNQLESNARQWADLGKGNLLQEISKVYKVYDANYNSELFAFHPCDRLIIDNGTLLSVIEGLNHARDNSYRYDFSVIPSDTLGIIYEQYLGHILKETPKRTKLSESLKHRKEQGIYYTPSNIVEYIIKNTLGEYLNSSKNAEVRAVRVLDPACGSGSFLIRAYQELEEFWAVKEGLEISRLDVVGEHKFYTRKVDILRENIHGVDLDLKAVEIAHLNLLLRISEKRQHLPLLKENIKVGNSLIDEPGSGISGFNWKEQFPDRLGAGGFDIVVGNPPYVESRDIDDNDWTFFRDHYKSAYKRFDLSVLFLERAISLLKPNGLLGFILTSKFAVSDYGLEIRKIILENCLIERIVDISNLQVFKEASTYPYILVLRKESDAEKRKLHKVKVTKALSMNQLNDMSDFYEIRQELFESTPHCIFSTELTPNVNRIIEKVLANSDSLSKLCKMKDGIHTGNVRDKLIVNQRIDKKCHKLITAESIDRYSVSWSGLWVRYDPNLIDSDKGEYGALRDEKIFTAKEKLVTVLFGKRPEVGYDKKGLYANNSVKIILPVNTNVNLKYILAVLNSDLIAFYYRIFFFPTHVRGGYMQFYPQDFLTLPIKKANKESADRISEAVDKVLELNHLRTELTEASEDWNQINKELKRLDAKLNEMIYQVYGLNAHQRELVERYLQS